MRARLPDREGSVDCGGVQIHYEVHGEGDPTILLMPTWTIVHKRFWKLQLAYLARHVRVITYDGPGNGGSTRSTEPADYHHAAQARYALAVLDATGADAACLVSVSMAANWALDLAANHPERVLGSVFIDPTLKLTPSHRGRAEHMDVTGPAPTHLAPSRVYAGGEDPASHWAKYNFEYWRASYEDFLWFFFGQCFPEPHSTKPIEDAVAWGLETSPEVLVAKARAAGYPDCATLEDWCGRVRCPVLVLHGEDDRISPPSRGERLAELTGGEVEILEGSGHLPVARDPVRIDLRLRQFAESLGPGPRRPRRRRWRRARRREKRVLYLSSPIGLGHARRDLAIAQALRTHHPDVRIDWLAQPPVTGVLARAGERVHPASPRLASESAHIEDECAEHDLHCFEALRRMDEILVANFLLFHDVVSADDYDLVVGDEAWEVDYFLHENPELKRFAYAWFTDFVGYLPMPDGGEREALLAADYNAEMIEQIARYPRIRDRSIFVGDPEDIVPRRFGEGLPRIREWTESHYDFAGYITGYEPREVGERDALRAELGYAPDEQVCIVTVGGSGVGGDLLRRVIAAYPEAKRRVPALKMVVVAGPRIEPSSLPAHADMEVHAYVHALHRHLACCDLAIVQGGLTTCMELVAANRPFIYVPLRHHFEQNFHVAHRLERYEAGRRLDYADATPERLAAAVAEEIGRAVRYRPVERDGADSAAALLADML